MFLRNRSHREKTHYPKKMCIRDRRKALSGKKFEGGCARHAICTEHHGLPSPRRLFRRAAGLFDGKGLGRNSVSAVSYTHLKTIRYLCSQTPHVYRNTNSRGAEGNFLCELCPFRLRDYFPTEYFCKNMARSKGISV